jgi:hypothetical protein
VTSSLAVRNWAEVGWQKPVACSCAAASVPAARFSATIDKAVMYAMLSTSMARPPA